jgi:hypothetical protein
MWLGGLDEEKEKRRTLPAWRGAHPILQNYEHPTREDWNEKTVLTVPVFTSQSLKMVVSVKSSRERNADDVRVPRCIRRRGTSLVLGWSRNCSCGDPSVHEDPRWIQMR